MSRASEVRAIAFEVVRATFERGAFTDVALREMADERGLEGRERAQAQRLAYGAVQRRGTSDAAIRRLAERSPRLLDPPVAAALRLGLYEVLFADATPDHAAVDQAVELVKGAGAAHAAGFANAVLRRATRERQELRKLLEDDTTPETAAIAHSVPRWLADLWWEELGADGARSLLAACNRPAERAFRVNTLRTERAALVARLREAGAEAHAAEGPPPLAPPESVVIAGSIAAALPLIEAGELVPQSRGSAAVVELLGPRPGEQVLDLCAGPGTKTGQIAARMGDRGEVISVERDPARAAQVADQAERLGLRSVTVIEADAVGFELGQRGFDRVLVDPPCSDLGTLASRPDARWRKSPRTIAELAELQGAILESAARALRPGGTLVYATCTIARAENEAQVARVGEGAELLVDDLATLAPGLVSEVDRRCLQLRPDRDRTTGFFIARFRRHD